MSRDPNEIMQEAIVTQACAWQARLLGDELSAADKPRFLRWLQDSPHNVREYLNQARIARLMPRAFEGLPADTVAYFPQTANHHRRFRVSALLRVAAAAGIVCGGVYVGLQYWTGRGTFEVSVPHGDQRTVRLNDGSIMLLNSQSEAVVRYSAGERLIELTQGQALFSVAQDKSRPFKVRADGTEVLALGTQFDVFRRAEGLTITVVEGKIAVRDLTLSAGEQVRLPTAAGSSVEPTVAKVDAHIETAWVRREIVFNGRPLGEVATEFNRYLSVPVMIEDARLRQIRVSGIFSAYDEAAFLAFLREFEGVQLDVGQEIIRVRTAPK